MTLKEVYRDQKKVLDEGYRVWFNSIRDSIKHDDDYNVADDELYELVLDLMVSHVLGEIITYDEVTELTLTK